MDNKFQTSFIPKKSITEEQPRKSGTSLFLVISIVIFLVTLGIAAYVFLENKLLIQQITTEQQTISSNKTGLVTDATTIQDLVELNNRINVANQLLSAHVAVTPIFDFLQQVTLKNVRFNDFSFSGATKDPSGNSAVAIQMTGQAKDFETVALQADAFGDPQWKNIIKEPKISNFNLNADGSVSFSFTGFISTDFLNYENVQNPASGSITQ